QERMTQPIVALLIAARPRRSGPAASFAERRDDLLLRARHGSGAARVDPPLPPLLATIRRERREHVRRRAVAPEGVRGPGALVADGGRHETALAGGRRARGAVPPDAGGLGLDEDAREPRMERKIEHAPADRGEATIAIDRAEPREELLGRRDRGGGRRVEPG